MAEKKAAAPTEYLVLRQEHLLPDDGGWLWALVQTVKAASAASAIKTVAATLSPAEQSGVFAAVPARSFRPTKVAPKTTVQLELTEVKA